MQFIFVRDESSWVNSATKFTFSWSTSQEDDRRGNENGRRTSFKKLFEKSRKSLNFEGAPRQRRILRFEILKMLRKCMSGFKALKFRQRLANA